MIRKVRETYQPSKKDQIQEQKKHETPHSYILPDEEHDPKEARKPYLPRTFGNLLNYITYTNRKRELVDFLNDVK